MLRGKRKPGESSEVLGATEANSRHEKKAIHLRKSTYAVWMGGNRAAESDP